MDCEGRQRTNEKKNGSDAQFSGARVAKCFSNVLAVRPRGRKCSETCRGNRFLIDDVRQEIRQPSKVLEISQRLRVKVQTRINETMGLYLQKIRINGVQPLRVRRAALRQHRPDKSTMTLLDCGCTPPRFTMVVVYSLPCPNSDKGET